VPRRRQRGEVEREVTHRLLDHLAAQQAVDGQREAARHRDLAAMRPGRTVTVALRETVPVVLFHAKALVDRDGRACSPRISTGRRAVVAGPAHRLTAPAEARMLAFAISEGFDLDQRSASDQTGKVGIWKSSS
jgi:hypothetical protein